MIRQFKKNKLYQNLIESNRFAVYVQLKSFSINIHKRI